MIINQNFPYILLNEEFFVACSVIILVLLLFRPLKKMINHGLDLRNHQIKKLLEDAWLQHKQAKKMLTHYQNLMANLPDENLKIMQINRLEIERLREEAKNRMKLISEQKKICLASNIAKREQDVLKEIRAEMLMIAIEASKLTIQDNLTQNISFSNPEDIIKTTINEQIYC